MDLSFEERFGNVAQTQPTLFPNPESRGNIVDFGQEFSFWCYTSPACGAFKLFQSARCMEVAL